MVPTFGANLKIDIHCTLLIKRSGNLHYFHLITKKRPCLYFVKMIASIYGIDRVMVMTDLDQYNYDLPDELIAKAPAEPRDSSRLFVYDTKKDAVTFDTFKNIGNYLPPPSLLVFNNTKVVPARLILTKEVEITNDRRHPRGGGKIEVLLMVNEYRPGDIEFKGIVDRKIVPPTRLYAKNGKFLDVVRQEEQYFFFKPSFPMAQIWDLLEEEGVTPIPPYIKEPTLSEETLRAKYQSVLAKHPASIAAPTASFHFTEELLSALHENGIENTEVTLHVGAGTFAPIDETNFSTKRLFTEYYNITKASAERINSAKQKHISIIPVGTTAMRTLESAAIQGQPVYTIKDGASETNIFIFPPYKFKIADALITNFHVPKSSLMLLVDAFLEHKNAKRDILDLYRIAVAEKFRFYSFGDSMLIL